MKKFILGKNRFEKNRCFIKVAALFMLAGIVALLAIPTHGLSLLAFAPGAVLKGGALAGAAVKFVAFGAVAPFKFIEPIKEVSSNTGNNTNALFQFPKGKRINTPMLVATVTKAAAGAGITSIPAVSDVLGPIQFKMDGKVQRTRKATDLFGATGLNALMSRRSGGCVVYSQVGNAALSTVPALIGSTKAAGTGYQGSLTANLATTATFYLPILVTEPFRKEYDKTEALCIPTSFDNGSDVGVVTLEVTIPDTSGNAVAISGQKVTCSFEYDELIQKSEAKLLMVKEYRHDVQYGAAGEIECATNIKDKKGALMRVSLLTATDQITKVVVTRGSRTIRNVTFGESVSHLINREYNEDAMIANRFDIEIDLNDDPASSLVNDPNNQLSIVATLATAADAGKTISVLSSFYGERD